MLRRTLRNCIKQSETAERIATRLLLGTAERADRKRSYEAKEEEFAVCKHCGTTFDINDNPVETPQCKFHPVELDIEEDAEIWDDYEPCCRDDHPSDTPLNREVYPDVFWFECCEGRINAPPCTPCPHEAVPRTEKRARQA
ncbi:hypothetical protein BCR35DRAFT_298522 [Leucosporidium creatinivorum]|uniref:Uncharacterized protein n=1 Tax=Leucosporidium creatinivorum TaxID=106004 RepID=A0A1Y2G4Q6_9BASI|nr:hypothetical protein BCR35DRAFT_298522 [Leucosporidium creatinivorum]